MHEQTRNEYKVVKKKGGGHRRRYLEYIDIDGRRILRTQDVKMCKYLKEAKTCTRSEFLQSRK